MQITTIEDKAVFQPVTVQITFNTLTELQAVKTSIGRNGGYEIHQRIIELGEKQSGSSDDYFNACKSLYDALDHQYKVAIK